MVAFLAALPFSFASCGDDEDASEQEISSSIVGTWKGLSVSGYGEIIEEGETYTQFKADGTYFAADYYEDEGFSTSEGEWYVKDDILYMTASWDLTDMEDITVPMRIVKTDGKTMTLELLGAKMKIAKVADSEMEAFIKKYEGMTPAGGQLSVNGTLWNTSSDNSNTFSGNDYDHYGYYWMLCTSYYKKPTKLSQVAMPDAIGFDIHSNFLGKGKYVEIKEGMDITNTNNFNWVKDGSGGNCCKVELCENMFQADESKPWVHGTYTQVVSGHAYIKKIEKDKKLTIQFDKLKLKLQEGYDNSYVTDGYDNSTPETVTLDGTVTYYIED